MAQSGFTPIILFNSTTAGNTPTTGNLAVGELAINAADGKLYYNTGSAIKVLAGSGGAGVVAGSNTQVQYNNSGVFGASSSFTFDGTTLTAPSYTFNTATTGSTNKGPLNYGTLNFSDTGIVQSSQTSVNSYFQNVIQNTSNGTQASAEFIVYNDQGTASTNYATVGINSSGYSGTGSINAPGYGYFLTASTDLVLGTIGANGIHFTTNSSATDALAISSAGAVSFPGGTANGVAYLNGSKVLTTGSALTFDGTNFATTGTVTANGRSKFIGASEPFAVYLRYNGSTNGVYLGSSAADTLNAYDSAGNPFLQFSSSADIFYIAGSEQMRLTSTGLGIGTSSPSAKLSVTTSTFSNSNYYIQDVNYVSGSVYPVIRLGYTGSGGSITNGLIDSGIWNLSLSTNNVIRATFDTSGNLGLGVTPSAWGFGGNLELPATNNISFKGSYGNILSNAYYSLANSRFQYTTTGYAAEYQIGSGGQHIWFNAPSGTAGNAISFTQAMTLDNSGNLGLGTTSPTSFGAGAVMQTVAGTTGYGGYLGSTNSVTVQLWANEGGLQGSLGTRTNHPILFTTNNTERARIDSSGRLLVGLTSVSSYPQAVTWQSSTSADGFSNDWSNVSSSTINIATLFPSVNMTNGSTVSVDLQVVTSSAASNGSVANILGVKQGNGTWVFTNYASIGGISVTASGSGTTITLTFGSGSQYGVARVKVVSH